MKVSEIPLTAFPAGSNRPGTQAYVFFLSVAEISKNLHHRPAVGTDVVICLDLPQPETHPHPVDTPIQDQDGNVE